MFQAPPLPPPGGRFKRWGANGGSPDRRVIGLMEAMQCAGPARDGWAVAANRYHLLYFDAGGALCWFEDTVVTARCFLTGSLDATEVRAKYKAVWLLAARHPCIAMLMLAEEYGKAIQDQMHWNKEHYEEQGVLIKQCILSKVLLITQDFLSLIAPLSSILSFIIIVVQVCVTTTTVLRRLYLSIACSHHVRGKVRRPTLYRT